MLLPSSKELFPPEPGNTKRYSLDAEKWKRGFASKERNGEGPFEAEGKAGGTEARSRHKIRRKSSVTRILESPFLGLACFRRDTTKPSLLHRLAEPEKKN